MKIKIVRNILFGLIIIFFIKYYLISGNEAAATD